MGVQDSSIASSSFSWDNSREPWRHVAVTVTQNVASRHNIFFYVDAWPRWKNVENMGTFGEKTGKTLKKSRERPDIFVWSTLGQKMLILYKFGVEHGPVDKNEDA